MCPPGLGFASPNERALARAAEPEARRATTSTGTGRVKGQRKDPPDSPFTPAVGARSWRSTSRSG